MRHLKLPHSYALTEMVCRTSWHAGSKRLQNVIRLKRHKLLEPLILLVSVAVNLEICVIFSSVCCFLKFSWISLLHLTAGDLAQGRYPLSPQHAPFLLEGDYIRLATIDIALIPFDVGLHQASLCSASFFMQTRRLLAHARRLESPFVTVQRIQETSMRTLRTGCMQRS